MPGDVVMGGGVIRLLLPLLSPPLLFSVLLRSLLPLPLLVPLSRLIPVELPPPVEGAGA